MKHLRTLFAGLALTLLAMAPAAARADGERDDLDATMTVLDSASDFDESMKEVDGPDHDEDHDADRDEAPEVKGEFQDELEEDFEDEFEHGDEEDSEVELEHEDDFEDGEDIDDDRFD